MPNKYPTKTNCMYTLKGSYIPYIPHIPYIPSCIYNIYSLDNGLFIYPTPFFQDAHFQTTHSIQPVKSFRISSNNSRACCKCPSSIRGPVAHGSVRKQLIPSYQWFIGVECQFFTLKDGYERHPVYRNHLAPFGRSRDS